MALSPLTPEQRNAALAKAFLARQERAEIKVALKAGKTSIREVLAQAAESEAVAKMKVEDMLRSLPGIGDRRASAVMKELGIAASRRLRGLGTHQRAALVERFDD